MKKSLFNQQKYLEPFIKTTQYLAGLTAQQDAWSEIGKALVTFFGADLVGFGERSAGGEIIGHHWVLPDRVSCIFFPSYIISIRPLLRSFRALYL